MRIQYERPLFALLELLKKNDIYVLSHRSKLKRSKLINDPFQELVLTLLLRKGCICKGTVQGNVIAEYVFQSKTYRYLAGKNSLNVNGAYYVDKCYSNDKIIIKHVDILQSLSNTPIIVIDFKFWDILLDKEKNRLLTQTVFTLYTVRKYLWDRNLVLSNIPNQHTLSTINKWLGEHNVILSRQETLEILEEMNIKPRDVILLDPNTEAVLTREDVMRAKAFIIGGIVDKIIPRHGLTSKLLEDVEVLRRKIVLKNSTVGVPHRINKIAEIVLATRYTYSALIPAIRSSQSKIDSRWRAYVELSRFIKKYKHYNMDLNLFIRNLSVWLNINMKDINIVKRRLNICS